MMIARQLLGADLLGPGYTGSAQGGSEGFSEKQKEKARGAGNCRNRLPGSLLSFSIAQELLAAIGQVTRSDRYRPRLARERS